MSLRSSIPKDAAVSQWNSVTFQSRRMTQTRLLQTISRSVLHLTSMRWRLMKASLGISQRSRRRRTWHEQPLAKTTRNSRRRRASASVQLSPWTTTLARSPIKTRRQRRAKRSKSRRWRSATHHLIPWSSSSRRSLSAWCRAAMGMSRHAGATA